MSRQLLKYPSQDHIVTTSLDNFITKQIQFWLFFLPLPQKESKKSSLPEGDPRTQALARKQFALRNNCFAAFTLRSIISSGESITFRALLPVTDRQAFGSGT
ncbi:hypothetical protein ACFSPU_08210 [Haoranjiania flava]|uniref:Uncharacterized protein n=1 Tax=Haoranjiania flava TaxID=1856322 RepID=A0AAE3LN66_9BACT|nr:hypothetical protein [Haoranjiania flava]MCU7694631.1 hypothetical protein [Haoranjiania flava]